MKIEITQEDIDKGRMDAGETCGCPIWQAVVRQLQIPESQAGDLVSVPDYGTLQLGGTKFSLPPEAVSLQRILVEYPLAHIGPCVFEAPVGDYSIVKAKSTVSQLAEKAENKSLLARIFS